MPDAPTVHGIATPRRTIGGRCRKWCISAQPPAGKRKCAVCSMSGIRFTHGEARLQQWRNRQTNNHYVHAHCVNGGLGHDHELHPKVADDQEAVDAVTRQRDTITRTAADTEVPLHFAQDMDQASTAAPPDDERICLDAKRLFAWMRRSWTSSGSNMLHRTASKICEGQRVSNLPRGSARCSKPNMPSFEQSFTTTQPLRPQKQPGKCWYSAAGSSWDDLQSIPLRATVPTSWMRGWSFFAEDWSVLWAMVRAECDVAPVLSTTRRTDKQQMQSRIRKVATLARTGEKGRALAAARNAPPVQVTEQIVQEIKSLYPADPEPPAPASAPISALFLSEVAEHVPITLEGCLDSVSQDLSASVLNTGMILAHWQEIVTCLCKSLHT